MAGGAVGMGAAVLLATALHGIEAATWASAYRLLGAPTRHPSLQWQLMGALGALEALNGILLFGLTTAFLFAMIQKVWPLGSRGWHREG